MNYIDDIFKRTNLQHLQSFLLQGNDCGEINNKAYKQRIDEARKAAFKKIEEKFDNEELDDIAGNIFDYVSVVQDVHMEIGIICGAKLMIELLAKSP